MRLPPEEPERTPWQVEKPHQVWARLLSVAQRPRLVIAIDGRGGAGKSMTASLLARTAPGRAEVVHTDDLAWHHSFFGWDEMLSTNVVVPFRNGAAVSFTPEAWLKRGRSGAVTVSSNCEFLIVEGTGVLRHTLTPLIDAGIYVQADTHLAYARLLARDGDTPETRAFIDEWDEEERPLLASEKPWYGAHLVVCGTPDAIELRPSGNELITSAQQP